MPTEKFDDWMKRVDALFEKYIGLQTDEIPDWGYYDAWFSGLTPREALTGYIEDHIDEMAEFADLI